jgi:hypothetical protein
MSNLRQAAEMALKALEDGYPLAKRSTEDVLQSKHYAKHSMTSQQSNPTLVANLTTAHLSMPFPGSRSQNLDKVCQE